MHIKFLFHYLSVLRSLASGTIKFFKAMKTFLTLIFGLFLSSTAFAQEEDEPKKGTESPYLRKTAPKQRNEVRPGNNNTLSSGGFIYARSLEKEKRKGSPYLFDDWKTGVVFITSLNKQYKFQNLRYNLTNSDVELKIDGEIKTLSSQEIKEFTIQDSASKTTLKFVRLNTFKGSLASSLSEFGLVVVKNETSLIKEFYTEYQRATYNPALNIGNNFDAIVHKENYYLVYKGKLYQTNKKKEIIEFYAEQGKDAKTFIKENDLDVKEEADLLKIVFHFNK